MHAGARIRKFSEGVSSAQLGVGERTPRPTTGSNSSPERIVIDSALGSLCPKIACAPSTSPRGVAGGSSCSSLAASRQHHGWYQEGW
jgi:hypothetical protein